MVKVTAKKLTTGGACEEGVAIFKTLYPRGVDLLQGIADIVGSQRANTTAWNRDRGPDLLTASDATAALDICAPKTWWEDIILAEDFTETHATFKWAAFYCQEGYWQLCWHKTEEKAYEKAVLRRDGKK